jgi:hypothetical protein
MRTKLTRFFTITVLALVLVGATVAPVAAQTRPSSNTVTVVEVIQTTVLNTEAHTVTVVTETYYSDGTWERVVDTWSYTDGGSVPTQADGS